MDGTVVILLIVILMPLAILFALAKAASLRGPLQRPESRRPVGSLVTEAIPEERAEPDEDDESVPERSIDSRPPDPEPEPEPEPDPRS